jgi:hypothetical protein
MQTVWVITKIIKGISEILLREGKGDHPISKCGCQSDIIITREKRQSFELFFSPDVLVDHIRPHVP